VRAAAAGCISRLALNRPCPLACRQFKSHEDGGSLTVLVVLSERAEYGGGGTGFWSKDAVEPPASGGWWGALSAALATQAGPSFVLAPPEGTALVFGGQVLHAGEQVVASHTAAQPRGARLHRAAGAHPRSLLGR
jgi:hypothetical protein